jgi:hypothetical protein
MSSQKLAIHNLRKSNIQMVWLLLQAAKSNAAIINECFSSLTISLNADHAQSPTNVDDWMNQESCTRTGSECDSYVIFVEILSTPTLLLNIE